MKTIDTTTNICSRRDGARGAWPGLLVAGLALAALAAACDGGGDGGPPPMATVSGHLFDDRGDPVPGALIEVASDPIQTTTDAEGYFSFQVAHGQHRLTASSNGLAMCEACFQVSPGEHWDVGDLYPGRRSECDLPSFCPGDVDCDGLTDDEELAGWTVVVTMPDGSQLERLCTSDPLVVDTDGDGLRDEEERAARTDPRRRDTDADALPDFGELYTYKSNPCMVDSDGDSRGPDGLEPSDPNLWDGFELLLTRTSPTLADTDGDGLTDWEEVHSGGTNPRVANLPSMNLDLQGEAAIVLNIYDQQGLWIDAAESTLEKETESYERTDTESTKMSIENTVKIHTEAEAGTSHWPPSFNAKMTTDTEFKQGYFTESLSSWTEGSVQESQQNYERLTTEHTVIDYSDGMLWAAVKIVNSSSLSFKVKDLRVTAYRLTPGGTFTPIGNLTPGLLGNHEWETYDDYEFVLGPSAEYTELVGADHLPAQIMRKLVANPTALLFEVGSYSLFQLDEFGVDETVNFAKLGEDVVQRTGLIVIDYGNGRIERYMAATNVLRRPDGSGRGLTMAEALRDVIGIDYETTLDDDPEDPQEVLTRVKTVATYELPPDPDDPEGRIPRGFWIVSGTGSQFDGAPHLAFDDIVLRSGERVSLVFVEDADGDGVFDREEYAIHTDRLLADTDRDGLSDYEEAKEGWTVEVQGGRPYRVFSDPRFVDLDEDYLTDLSESNLGTDPYAWDTDGDGYSDAFDYLPLVPECLDGMQLGLGAWLDGTVSGNVAEDVWYLDDGVLSDALMSDPAIAYSLGENQVFRLNPGIDQRTHYLDAPSAGLSATHEYTVAVWLYWQGVAAGQDWATVLSKGNTDRPTYAVSVSADGALRHSLYRHVYEKCWDHNLNCDGCCKDKGYYDRFEAQDSTAGVIPEGEWVHVVVTFGNDWMRAYVDAVELDPNRTLDTWSSGIYSYERKTVNLVANTMPLRIGTDPSDAAGPFRGFLDDFQYFNRVLSAEEVTQLYLRGLCPPSPTGF